MDTRKAALLDAMRFFISRRPGLEFCNYGDWAIYRAESREITKDRHHAEALIHAVAWRDSITADDIIEASRRAFSGRLEIEETEKGFSLGYCAGQYYPTEYRKAACAVLASALWEYWRDSLPPECDHMGDAIRKTAKREMGRPIAARWFN